MWSWLDSGGPSDYSDVRYVTRDDYEVGYYRFDYPGINTLSDLSDALSRYVDRDFVEQELADHELFREFDGVLYVLGAGRGDDITIAYVEYEVQMDPGGESGKVIATIHRQDFDDETSEWYLTGEKDVSEFPFTLRDGHALFETMHYLY